MSPHMKVTHGGTVQMDDASNVVTVPGKSFFYSVKRFLLTFTCITDGLMLMRVCVWVCVCTPAYVTMSPLL